MKTPNGQFEQKPLEDTEIYKQCVLAYNTLAAQAEETEFNGEKIKQWRGALTKLFSDLGIPMGSYNKVRTRLTDLGCITVSTEGRTRAGSTVFLHFSPESIVWDTAQDRRRRRLTPSRDVAILRQQVAGISDSLGGLDVRAALIHLQKQITALELKIAQLQKERTGGS